MSSLAAYRALVPAHSSIADETVEAWLEYAAGLHTASEWGNQFVNAMVWLAAHQIERDPTLGSGTATETGSLMMESVGDLQRQYQPLMNPTTSPGDAELQTTRYGLNYLRIRDSRAATQPTTILAGL